MLSLSSNLNRFIFCKLLPGCVLLQSLLKETYIKVFKEQVLVWTQMSVNKTRGERNLRSYDTQSVRLSDMFVGFCFLNLWMKLSCFLKKFIKGDTFQHEHSLDYNVHVAVGSRIDFPQKHLSYMSRCNVTLFQDCFTNRYRSRIKCKGNSELCGWG